MNRCLFVGTVDRDAELKFTQAGKQFASFRITVSEPPWKEGGKPSMLYLGCTDWRPICEKEGALLRKGDQVFVEGSISVRFYEGRDGGEKMSLELKVQSMKLLTSNTKAPEPDPAPARRQVPEAQPLDDDLPF